MSTESLSPASAPSTSSRTFLLAGAGLVAVVIVALAAWYFFLRDEPYEFHGGFYEPPTAAAPFTNATDQHGNPFNLEDFEGKVVFLYFGYTHCPDACPATLDSFMEVKEILGADAENVEFVFVTVDPERDTPERITEYLEFWDPEFYGVSMPEDDTLATARGWNIFYTYREANSQGGYMVDHQTSSFVVDKNGNLRLTYPLGFDSAKMAEDAEHLLDQ